MNKKMRGYLCLALSLLLALCLAACGGSDPKASLEIPELSDSESESVSEESSEPESSESSEESAKTSRSSNKTFTNDRSTPAGTAMLMLDICKTMDIQLMQEYTAGDTSFIEDLNDPEMVQALNIIKRFTDGMEYEVLDEVIQGDKAYVTISITTFDGTEFVEDMMTEIMSFAISAGADVTEEQIVEYLMDYLDRVDMTKFSRQTNETVMELFLDEGMWMVDANDELFSAMMGNIDQVIEEMGF